MDRVLVLAAAREVLEASPLTRSAPEYPRDQLARQIATAATKHRDLFDHDVLHRLKGIADTLDGGAPSITVASFKQMAHDVRVLLHALGEAAAPPRATE